MDKHLSGVKSIAEYLKMSPSSIKRRIKRGLPCYKDGHTIWALKPELDEWRKRVFEREVI